MSPLLIVVIVIASLVLVYLLLGAILFFVFCGNKSIKRIKKKNKPNYAIDVSEQVDSDWFFNNFKIVSTKSYDHKIIQSYFLENANSDLYIIYCHGWTGEPEEKSAFLKDLYNKYNCNIISLVQRGQTISKYHYLTMGAKEGHDLNSWCNYVTSINKKARIVVYGQSMGAATVMYASSYGYNDNVIGAIEDCGYRSIRKQFDFSAKSVNIPKLLRVIGTSSMSVTMVVLGISQIKHNPIDGVKKMSVPFCMIHGDKDELVPYENFPILKEKVNKNIYLVNETFKGAMHIESYTVDREKYCRTIFDFIDYCIKKSRN